MNILNVILILLAVILLGAEAARTRSLGWAGLCLWALTVLLTAAGLVTVS